jgi:RHS repeat-associated protein
LEGSQLLLSLFYCRAPQYRFERQDGGVWSVVQAYGSGNTYTWTPVAADAGDHSVRVSVRNSGSISDFEDTRTMATTITTGSGALAPRRDSLLARVLERWAPRAASLSLSVNAQYASAAVGDLRRISLYTPELNLMSETEAAVETTSGTPAVAYDYIWFGGKPVAQVDVVSNTTHWTFTDHLGTPILQTDAAGTVDWRAEYEPFGTMYAQRTGTTRHQPLRFPGQESDAADGEREYNIHRWYRAGWGRYTQGDRIGFGGGLLNLYSYTASNPLSFVDTDGLQVAYGGSTVAVSSPGGGGQRGGDVVASRSDIGISNSEGGATSSSTGASIDIHLGIVPFENSIFILEKIAVNGGIDLPIPNPWRIPLSFTIDGLFTEEKFVGFQVGVSTSCSKGPARGLHVGSSTTVVTSFSDLWAHLDNEVRHTLGGP